MKTHEFASLLRDFADMLDHLPDTEITAFPEALRSLSMPQEENVPLPLTETEQPKSRVSSDGDIFETLTTLPKKEIVAIIRDANVDIPIRVKDSGRDVALKIRTHLRRNPTVARKLRSNLKRRKTTVVSEPLSKALGTLLGNRDEVSNTGC